MRTPTNSGVGSTDRRPTRGFSLIELLIVVAIILIIAAIAIPSLLRSKLAANQASAVSNLRTITSGAVSYWVTYNNGYPPSLAALGGVSGTPATCDASILIDETIAALPNQKAGYQFTYTPEEGLFGNTPPSCTNNGPVGYLLTAAPLSFGVTGDNSYCSTEEGIIHYDPSGATAADQPTCQALLPLQ